MYEAELNQKPSDFDWPLLLCAAGLMVFGTAFVFSATAGHRYAAHYVADSRL